MHRLRSQGLQTGGNLSGDYSTIDMVNRLEPIEFRWIESSPAEQELLGWTLTELREKSFLDILHPDDQKRCQRNVCPGAGTRRSIGAGRPDYRTAHGKTRAIEVNVGARYGTNQTSHPSSLPSDRCHREDASGA